MVLRKTRCNKQRKRRRRGRRTRRKRMRKRRTRRRRARSKQRGGMNIRITDKMIANWANPHNLPNDCCPCVFSLLGMPHAIANALATANLQGMGAQQMMQLFSHYYPNYTFTAPAVAVTPGDAFELEFLGKCSKYCHQGMRLLGATTAAMVRLIVLFGRKD